MTTEHTIPEASALIGWRKSSYSGSDQGSCVEVTDAYTGIVPVRDSKDPSGPALLMSVAAWTRFLDLAKR